MNVLRRGDLAAYADDIACRLQNRRELVQIIIEFESLETDWNLRINRKKCEILSPGGEELIRGILCKQKVK